MIVDAYSGRTIAQTGQMRSKGETFLMGGRVLEVVWRDRYRLGVRDAPGKRADETLRFMTAPFAVPLDVSQAVAVAPGGGAGQLALVHDEQGALLFHFWGDLYGALLGAMLQAELTPDDEAVVHCSAQRALFAPAGKPDRSACMGRGPGSPPAAPADAANPTLPGTGPLSLVVTPRSGLPGRVGSVRLATL